MLGLIALGYGYIPILEYEKIPQVFGVGYETIESGLLGKQLVASMVLLMALKILATALTVGSGGSGGVFAPGLFIGSMLGGCFGLVAHGVFPGLPAPVGAYALVGMGALFAGATQASMTAVVIMFEMTGDYNIILPLMLSVVTAAFLGRYLMGGESIYTLKLSRRGIRLLHGRVMDVLEGVRVSEVMTRDVVTVLPETPIQELTELFLQTNRHAFPVLDERERLVGIVSLTDLRNAESDQLFVKDLMISDVVRAYPDEALDVALGRMGPHDLSRLPVVSRADPHRLLGVIRRNDLVRAYNLALTRKSRSATGLPMHLRRAPDTEFVEIRITPTTAAKGRSVAELSRRFPSESLLISIRRAGGEIVFPRGDTRFLAGDRITAYVRSGHVTKLHEAFERPFA